ncbi:hypothetical protein STEG23_006081 [Scotinomys teguina]
MQKRKQGHLLLLPCYGEQIPQSTVTMMTRSREVGNGVKGERGQKKTYRNTGTDLNEEKEADRQRIGAEYTGTHRDNQAAYMGLTAYMRQLCSLDSCGTPTVEPGLSRTLLLALGALLRKPGSCARPQNMGEGLRIGAEYTGTHRDNQAAYMGLTAYMRQLCSLDSCGTPTVEPGLSRTLLLALGALLRKPGSCARPQNMGEGLSLTATW